MIGATNMLFKQKKGVSEVIIDIGMYLGSLKDMESVGVKYWLVFVEYFYLCRNTIRNISLNYTNF